MRVLLPARYNVNYESHICFKKIYSPELLIAEMKCITHDRFCFVKGFKDIVSTAKSRLSFGERAVFWLYDKIREWSRKWLTHFFLLFIAAGYCAAGALIFQAVEGRKQNAPNENLIVSERFHFIMRISRVSDADPYVSACNVRNDKTFFALVLFNTMTVRAAISH